MSCMTRVLGRLTALMASLVLVSAGMVATANATPPSIVVTPGTFLIEVGGTPMSKTAVPNMTQLGGAVGGNFSGSGVSGTWSVSSLAGAGTVYAPGTAYPPAKGMKPRFGSGQDMAYSGSGMKPGTTVTAMIGPSQTGTPLVTLPSAVVASDGSFTQTATLPSTLPTGNTNEVYLLGTATNGAMVGITIGAIVRGGNAMITTYPAQKVKFAAGSSKLTSKDRNALLAYLKTADMSHVLDGMVKASYQGGGKSLASKRAAAVQNFVQNNGVTGTLTPQVLKGSAKKSNTVVLQLSMGQG